MTDTPPHLTYYRACEGRWRAPLELLPGFETPPGTRALAPADALGVAALRAWPLGGRWLHTSVTVLSPTVVMHTTEVRVWGLPVMWSHERLVLDDDGRHFTIEGGQRVFPWAWVERPIRGTGEVDPTARHATYTLAWLGTALRQRTTRHDDGVDLEQWCGAFVGVQRLRRA